MKHFRIIWAATDKEISMFEIFDQLEVFPWNFSHLFDSPPFQDAICYCPSLHFLYNYYFYLKSLHKGDANKASKVGASES